MKSAFFVGVGAQKAGTTWLWSYLQSHPEVGVSPIKELHFFDSKFTAAHSGANRELPRVRGNLSRIGRYARTHPGRGVRLAGHYLGMLAQDEASYRRFLRTARGGKRIAGEITPSYTLLDRDGIAAIERVLDEPRYLLILRNPADRFWSQVRFRARWRDDLAGTRDLIELLQQETYLLRSSCARVYQALAQVIADGRLHVAFYETLFDRATGQAVCDGICDFLGIDRHPADFGMLVNVGDHWSTDRFDRPAVVRALQQDYRLFAREYGDALPESWRRDLDRLA